MHSDGRMECLYASEIGAWMCLMQKKCGDLQLANENGHDISKCNDAEYDGLAGEHSHMTEGSDHVWNHSISNSFRLNSFR